MSINRHDYRGRIWFILQDLASGRSHKLSPAAYRLVGLMNGKRTMGELWDISNVQLGASAPTQDEAIRLMGQLHSADTVICDIPPDSRELFRRQKRSERMLLKQKFWSPLAVRIPIWDPDRFLNATMPVARPFFSRVFVLIWLAVVILAAVLAVTNFGAITNNITDRVLTPQNLFVLWLVYPVVKAFHELGHGYAVKKFGGEVHEIGIMFLVLIPVPYVDASAATGLRDKYQRMLVGGVGIMVEMFLASIALFVWLNAESGVVHTIAYNVMLIGGVSTLLFNGNPLLRFDGYYVLSDWIEIPNLAGRSTKHLGYLIQKYLFGVRDAEAVTSIRAERNWFVGYGIAAFIYRIFIMFAIIASIAGRFFIVGVILAIWALTTQMVVPLGKNIGFLANSPKLRSNRPRAILTTLGLLCAVIWFLFVLPAPSATVVEGVTWPNEQAQLRAGTNGFITTVAPESTANAMVGDLLISVDDPFLQARHGLMTAELAALDVQRSAYARSDRVQAALIVAEIEAMNSDLARLTQQIDELDIRAPRIGTVVIPNRDDLLGQFITKGDVIGYVIAPQDTRTVRVVVDQDHVDRVRHMTQSVSVMPIEWNTRAYGARIVRTVPGASRQLPTPALGLAGGGRVPVDPSSADGTQTLDRIFEFDILLDDAPEQPLLGRRVAVRFDHGMEPLGFQAYRALRQLFLRIYNV
ncbi:HlyD family efflux transporter periplasmic adaptor subunit [Yoonia sp.]|uniref:HlyD family efflux transporter periplasmic adaptor subunit n=1 Tax=Yoonia sp. TaxID=2212373 RepID=UPI003F4AEAC7